MTIEGLLKEDGIDKWRLFLNNGETISLANGQLIDLYLPSTALPQGLWVMTNVIEYQGRCIPALLGLKFYHNQKARIDWPALTAEPG